MVESKIQNSAFRGIKWSTIGTLSRALFQFLQLSVLTRFLPVEAFGLVAMALFVINFTNIFVEMGFTSAILHNQTATTKEYNSLFWFNLFLSIVLFGIIVSISPFISKFYNEPELNNIVPILGLNIVFLAAGRVHLTILQKDFKFKQVTLAEVLASLIAFIFSVVLAINNFGVYSLVYSTLLMSLVSSIVIMIFNASNHSIKLHFNQSEIKPFLRVGSYSMASKIVSFFSTDIDILIIGKTLGPGSLGLYSLSKQFVLKLFSIINPIITNVLSPVLSSFQNNPKKVKNYFLKVVSIISKVNIPIYLIIAVVSSELLEVVYGKEYSKADIILSFLAIVYCINSISNPVGSLQIATGRTDIGLKWALFSLVITPIVIYLASLHDINSVAVSRAFLSLVMIIPLAIIQLKPMADISVKEYSMKFYKPLSFFLAITFIFYFLKDEIYMTNNIILNAFIKAFTTLFLYFIFIYTVDKKSVTDTFSLFISALNRKK